MIELRGVSKFYQNEGNVQLGLRRASITFNKGEFVAITGESGSGKSTLLNVISGLDRYDEGEMLLNNEATSYFSIEDMEKYRKEYVGFIFQDYNIIDSYTVYENVIASLIIQNYPKKQRKERALKLIEAVGLSKQKNQKTVKLSGGQKQRVVIARALAKDSPIIVADEPTGNLDQESGLKVMELLKEISKDKLVIVVTHNYNQVAPYATRRVHLFDGEIVEDKHIKKVDSQEFVPTTSKPMGYVGQFFFAFLNIFRQPKKSIILFLSLIVLMTGTLVMVAAQRSTADINLGYHNFIENPFEQRVIVKKNNGEVFTQAELDELLNRKLVRSIIHYDVMLDSNVIIENDWLSAYSQTMPSSAVDSVEEGRLPTNDKEIVLPRRYKEDFNSNSVTLSYNSRNDSLRYSFTVVGYTNTSKVILHDSFINQTTTNTPVVTPLIEIAAPSLEVNIDFWYNHQYNHNILKDTPNLDIRVTNDVTDIAISRGYINDHFIDFDESANSSIEFQRYYKYQAEYKRFEVKIIEDNAVFIAINPELYGDVGVQVDQIALIVKDKYDAESVMNALDTKTYMLLHPSSINKSAANTFSIMFYILMIIVVGFCYIILNVIVKNIYKAKNKDIAIMRSIGASKGDIRMIYLFESVIIVFLSASIAVVGTYFLGKDVFKQPLLKILGTGQIVLYILIFFGLQMLIIHNFLNKLFGRTVIQTLRGGQND